MTPNAGESRSHRGARTLVATLAGTAFAVIAGVVVYGVVHCLQVSDWGEFELVVETVVGALLVLFCASGGWKIRRFLRADPGGGAWLLGWLMGAIALAVIYAAFYFSITVNN
jgi:hypothetical protein